MNDPVRLSARLALIACTAIGIGMVELEAGRPARAADLIIQVTGMDRLAGDVHFGVYDKEGEFPSGLSVAGDNKPADQETVVFRVADLAPGQYAVAVYHDANGNGRHDVSLWQIEDFGFSQNARAFFGPPKFDAAAFNLVEADTTITIDLAN